MGEITVSRLTEATPEAVAQLNHLIPQLKPSWEPITVSGLSELLASASLVFVARCADEVIGVTVLVPHRHMPGLRFYVEDVVVDERFRRRGIARELLTFAMTAVPQGALSVDLRSHPFREAAHSLYLDLGFAPSGTTVFRKDLSGSGE